MRYSAEFTSEKGRHNITHGNKRVLMVMIKNLMRKHIKSGISVCCTIFDLYTSRKELKRITI